MTTHQQIVLWFWSGLMTGFGLSQILTTGISMWRSRRREKIRDAVRDALQEIREK